MLKTRNPMPCEPSFTAIDFELARTHFWSICQVGLVRVERGIVTVKKSILVQPPQNKYDWFPIRVHGITPAMTADSPTFDKIWPEIEPYIRNQTIVAHNAKADSKYLSFTLKHYNIASPLYKLRCTYQIYKKGLKVLCDKYQIPLNQHDALSDALACAELYSRYLSSRSKPENEMEEEEEEGVVILEKEKNGVMFRERGIPVKVGQNDKVHLQCFEEIVHPERKKRINRERRPATLVARARLFEEGVIETFQEELIADPVLENQDKVSLEEPSQLYFEGGYWRAPKVVTVDSLGHENISFVSISAQKDYIRHYDNHNYIARLPIYHRWPGLGLGLLRMFEVRGRSMVPTLNGCDIVVAEFIENLHTVRSGEVYVGLLKGAGVVIKRVLNHIDSNEKLIFKSDNTRMQDVFPPMVVPVDDVIEMWHVIAFFSPCIKSMPSESYKKLIDLEGRLILAENRIRDLER